MKNQNLKNTQNEIELKRLFLQFSGTVDQLLEGRQGTVSYQLSYDTVYKLTKQQKQIDLLNILDQKLILMLQNQFSRLDPTQGLHPLFIILQNVKETTTRLAEVCLFLDLNYCQKQLNCPIRNKLSQTLFKTLSKETKVLDIVALGIFKARKGENSDFSALLKSIEEIDEKEQFFEKYLLSSYIPLLKSHYNIEAREFWEKSTIEEYLLWCRNELQEERKFLTQYFVKRRGQEGVEAAVAIIYSQGVTNYKQKIYQTDQTKIFETLSLSILQLFKYGRNKQVQGHIQWFMGAIERRLNKIPLADNSEFLKLFCALYENVSSLLQNTQSKFDINYRSVFTFQEWINNQKFNIPLRLNLLIDNSLRNYQQNGLATFTHHTILVFKLVKEKTLFQNLYRRMLLARLVQNYATYDLQHQLQLVEAMEKQCGEEWTKKIKSICALFIKNRNGLLKTRNIELPLKDHNWNLGGLMPVIVQEDDWPFEHKQTKISLHPQLMDLCPAFQKQYLPQTNSHHRLLWSPRAGMVTLSIKFKKTIRQFLVSVDMANLLLFIQKKATQLAHYLCETGYKIDQIEGGVQSLITAKIITSTPKGNDFVVELVQDFQAGALVDLIRGFGNSKVEVRAMQQLKADRKLMVQAIIVKIMKSEKVAKRDQIVQKSAPFLAQRGFNFNADFVQKSIDRLLDKQFLRDLEDGSLGYIA